jgi:hypothetical protein
MAVNLQVGIGKKWEMFCHAEPKVKHPGGEYFSLSRIFFFLGQILRFHLRQGYGGQTAQNDNIKMLRTTLLVNSGIFNL